jgi:putative SOS response-associated peptidase YedK
MCNLYSETNGQEVIRKPAGVSATRQGIDPRCSASSQRRPLGSSNAPDGVCELAMLRWSMPSPPQFLKPGAIDPGVTNMRDAKSAHRKRRLDRYREPGPFLYSGQERISH